MEGLLEGGKDRYPVSDRIENKILELLAADAAPTLNRVMLVRVRQTLEASVTQDDYFKALDVLEQRGLIGRLRGAGGQIYRQKANAALTQPIAERNLMAPTLAFLSKEFVSSLELPKTSSSIVVDTSKMGPVTGTWARPDFILITVTTYPLMPGRHVDVHSFELKNTTGGSVSSVHEALAQTRFTHYGHFIWHLPRGAKKEYMLSEVLSQCDEHGIGFIRAYDPTNLIEGWEVLKTPRRKTTHVGVVDAFLQERLSPSDRLRLTNPSLGG